MILNKRISKSILLVCFIFFNFLAAGQMSAGNENTGGIIVTGKTGISYLISEVYRDFSGTATEFNNMPGAYTGMEVSRFFNSSLEAGSGISYSHLRGQTSSPVFSATGFHVIMMDPFDGPVQYDSRLFGPEIYARYHIIRNGLGQKRLNLFMKAGAGMLFYESELFYSDRREDEIIFGKGYGKHKTTKVSSGVFILGGGLNYDISNEVSLKLGSNFNIVGYDFLDVVHNFDSAGNRKEVFGIFSDLTIGIAINLKGRDNSNGSNLTRLFARSHLPFAPL